MPDDWHNSATQPWAPTRKERNRHLSHSKHQWKKKLWLYWGTIWLNGMIWLWNEVTRVLVEPPCVTTSQVLTIHKRQLNIQNIKLFLVNGLTVGTPREQQLAPVMVQGLYGTTFWGWKFYNFPLFNFNFNFNFNFIHSLSIYNYTIASTHV